MERASNPLLKDAVAKLKKAYRESKRLIWLSAAELLSRAGSRRRLVSVAKLARTTKRGDVVLVPGKVLGTGLISHEITVGAFSFTASAAKKIEAAGGEALTLPKFLEAHGKTKGLMMVGG